ncbi:MAG: O-antigen ligase family protein [Solirubrobacterales bacterium]
MTRSSIHAGVVSGAFAAAAVLAVALAGGGSGGVALGVITAAVWIALLLAVLAGRLPAGPLGPGLSSAAAFLAVLLALSALSVTWTTSADAAFEEVVRIAGYLGAFLAAGLLARRARIGPVLTGLAVGGVVVSLVALGARLGGIGSGDTNLVAILPTAAGRLSFPVGYWNALGALMALSLPVLCWRAATAPTARLRGLALAGFPPLLLAGYMTSSRGAVLAIVLGLAVTVAYSADRRRAAAAAALGLLAAAPALVVASIASGLLDSPGDGAPHGPELVTIAALLAGVAFALVAAGGLVGGLAGSRPFAIRVPIRAAAAVAAGAVVALVIVAGPSAVIGDLRAGNDPQTSNGNDRATTIISASGSGRAQFWETALEAFGDEPVRGIGAGGFADYWNQHGEASTPAENSHSEPLEVLAELGLLGFIPFGAFIAVILGCAVSRARAAADPDEGAAAALGLLAAGMIGFAIDWNWQVPAVVVPVMVAAGMTAALADPLRAFAWMPRPSPRAVAYGAVALAVPAVWAAAVLALGAASVQRSEDALAAGRLDDAATSARTAAAIQPWAAEPWIRLAAAESAAGNFDAAAAAAGVAIDRNPSSLDAWSLLAQAQAGRGEGAAAFNYASRGVALGAGG